jgi:hypothetical protein
MSSTPSPNSELAQIIKQLPDNTATVESLDVKAGEGFSDKIVDAIEMLEEEDAAALYKGSQPPPREPISAALRFLHCSRTIHQLVTDRNRAVGIFLAVASLLLTACSALMNAAPTGRLLIPLETMQRWCFPLTFGALTVLAVFVALLLVRTRAGLIYESAKMNALLGLPLGRVAHLNPLSIFFLMQTFISLAGGLSTALFVAFLMGSDEAGSPATVVVATIVGIIVAGGLLAMYVFTVKSITSDQRLKQILRAS